MSKKETVNSGINLKLVNESTSKLSKSASGIINFLSRFLIVFALSAGAIFTFTSMMNVKQIDWIVYCVVAVASLAFSAFYKAFSKSWLVFLLGIAAAAIAWLFMLTPVITGFQLIYDSAIKSIYDAMFWTAPDPIIKWNDSYISNTTYCICMLSVVVTAAVGYFTVAKTQFIGAFLFTFAFFEIGAAFGCVADKISFALLLSGWAAILVLHISNRQKNTVKHKNLEKITKHKQFVYKNKSERFGGSALVMAVSVFLSFVIITNVLVSSGFSRAESLNDLRKNVKYTALNVYDLVTGYDHDASLKDGDLSVLGDRKVLNRHYATLQIPALKQDLYFRGYVGSIYTGTSWKTFDDETYKKLDNIKKYFTEEEYTIPTVTGDLLDSDLDDKKLKNADFKFSDFRRKKDYMYTLNGTVSSMFIGGYQDAYAVNKNDSDEYSFNAYYDQTDFINLPYTSSFKNEDFQKAWQEYVSFVNSYYTLLPSGIDEVAKLGSEVKGDTIYKTVDLVRDFLSENTTYSDKVSKLPDGKDFVSNFIFDKGVGYSAHYASAAAVMLRSLGVPARYVEGYYVSAEQIAKTEGDGNVKNIEITDGNHHAWIEVFDASYGWIPVEVTTGFYNKSFAEMMQQEQQKAEKKNKDKDEEKQQKNENNNSDNQSSKNDQNVETQPKEDLTKDPIENKTTEYKESNILLYIAIVLATILFLLIIFAVAIILRRHSLIKKRSAVFNSNNYRKQVVLGFELLIKMLAFKKAQIGKLYSYDEFRAVVENNFITDNKDEFSLTEIFEIYEKTMFSKQPITETEAQKVLDFIDEFGYGLYKNLTVIYRLKWKYIDVLS